MNLQLLEDIKEWIMKIPISEVPIGIKAFNFGIFETENGYNIYLIGSKVYDSTDDDWACEEDFTPSQKYLPISHHIHRNKDWEEIQKLVSNVLDNYFTNYLPEESIFGDNPIITTGLDGGNLVRITPTVLSVAK